MSGAKVVTGAAAAVLLVAWVGLTPALGDTIDAALVRAYQNNPQLNAQRAIVRSTDENVPQALSGYRPKVAITASAGYQYTNSQSSAFGSNVDFHGAQTTASAGGTATQTLYNGNQTANKTRAAESHHRRSGHIHRRGGIGWSMDRQSLTASGRFARLPF